MPAILNPFPHIARRVVKAERIGLEGTEPDINADISVRRESLGKGSPGIGEGGKINFGDSVHSSATFGASSGAS